MDIASIYTTAQQILHWTTGTGPKEYGQYLQNKRGYSHKRTNRKHNHK